MRCRGRVGSLDTVVDVATGSAGVYVCTTSGVPVSVARRCYLESALPMRLGPGYSQQAPCRGPDPQEASGAPVMEAVVLYQGH